ncbi:HlyD family secretion protein [Avibacterium avium]|uniref:HlyD family secretion protein n=1 Tax=Avibacterium avium TaxID=751 RepID=UPI003BF8F380
MELLILVIYASLCVGIFKLFKIPLNKWSVPTAVLGGVILLLSMLLVMNYNHPHTKLATQYYISTPIIPNVGGKVIEVNPVNANQLVKKGEVLFKIDPTPYQAMVDQRSAELALAVQTVSNLAAEKQAAQATVEALKATMEQKKREFERYQQLIKSKAASQSELDLKRKEYYTAKADYSVSLANLTKVENAFATKYENENANIAKAQAALKQAQFNLDSTVVVAPTDGFIAQNLLNVGMTATTLPIRPVMTFTHHQDRMYVAAFRQNSLLRLSVGDEAEIVFPAIPGKTFQAEIVSVLPAIGEHELQANGTLYTESFIKEEAKALVLLKMKSDMSAYSLPYGVSAEVAVYTEHAHHLAMMRKILLRMNSWKNYLYLDH